MNTLKAKAISEIRSTIATLSAHQHNEPNSEFADRIEGLQVLLGELEAEEVSKGTPTYQEIEDFAETFMMPGQVANKEIKEASIKSAQWAISLQPEWMSISERLPDLDQKVSVLINGKSDFAIYGEDINGVMCFTGLDFQYDFANENCPTHWTELPQPPTK